MNRLGVWGRLGIVASVLWVIVDGWRTYLDLSMQKEKDLELARSFCEGAMQAAKLACEAPYLNGFTNYSETLLAMIAVGISAVTVLVFWIMIAIIVLVAKWVMAGRNAS